MNCRISFVCIFISILIVVNSNEAKDQNEKVYIFQREINRFCADIYKSLAKHTKSNFIVSPISVLLITAMAAYGANGKTRQQLDKALNLPIEEQFVIHNFQQLIRNANNLTSIELHLANKLFVDNQFNISSSFQKMISKVFLSEIETIDFQNINKSIEIMNDWSLKITNNKVKDVINADDLKNVQLVIANAVNFKGSWAQPFTKSQDKMFYLSEIDAISIPMTCNYADYNHGFIFNYTAKYIELPYKTDDLTNEHSMYIISSYNHNGLDAISDRFHEIDFKQLNNRRSAIKLCIPKIKIESKLNLIPTLNDMGIDDMFKNTANFSNIAHNQQLKISRIIQKALINVDEHGSEAAGISGAIATWRMLPTEITVDRPFILAIIPKTSGTPLFFARVNDPRI